MAMAEGLHTQLGGRTSVAMHANFAEHVQAQTPGADKGSSVQAENIGLNLGVHKVGGFEFLLN